MSLPSSTADFVPCERLLQNAISDSCSLRNKLAEMDILPARTRGLGPVVWWGLWVICRTNSDPLGI